MINNQNKHVNRTPDRSDVSPVTSEQKPRPSESKRKQPVHPENMNREEKFPDSLKLFLDEVAQYPLLNSEEEQALCRRIACGDSIAKDLFIVSNLRLVVHIAKKFTPKCDLPLLDLISEGAIGLMDAVDRFDVKRGNRFSTYAEDWIYHAIEKAIADQCFATRIPKHTYEQVVRISSCSRKLVILLERTPTQEEIANELKMNIKKIQMLQNISLSAANLDAPIDENRGTPLIELIEDNFCNDPALPLINLARRAAVKEALNTLPEREADILRYLYGWHDDHCYSLSEVAKILGISKERVRQLQGRALKSLRSHKHSTDWYELLS